METEKKNSVDIRLHASVDVAPGDGVDEVVGAILYAIQESDMLIKITSLKADSYVTFPLHKDKDNK